MLREVFESSQYLFFFKNVYVPFSITIVPCLVIISINLHRVEPSVLRRSSKFSILFPRNSSEGLSVVSPVDFPLFLQWFSLKRSSPRKLQDLSAKEALKGSILGLKTRYLKTNTCNKSADRDIWCDVIRDTTLKDIKGTTPPCL